MPSYLIPTLTYSGYILMALAVLLSLAASFESRVGLNSFCVISFLLMVRLVALVIEINYSSLVLAENLTKTCAVDLLPHLNQTYYLESLDCGLKYTHTAQDLLRLSCSSKAEMTLVWENV